MMFAIVTEKPYKDLTIILLVKSSGGVVQMVHRILIVCTTDSMIYNFLIPHIKNMIGNGNEVICASSRTGDYFDILQSEYGFRMHRIDFERSPYKLSNLKAYKDLKKLIRTERIDYVFCHEPVGGALGRLAGHACRCNVIYMAHGFHFYKGAPKYCAIYYFVEKWLSRYTDTLITINAEDYEASRKFHAKKSVLVNGIGVNTKKFEYSPDPKYLRTELDLGAEETILLSVGELIVRKNHATVIKAIKALNDKRIHYVIAGDGELANNLKNLVSEIGLEKQVHFLGYRRDINKLCNAADVFIMPSFQEGLSVALMEAMACGLPIIASRIRGNTDLIIEGQGGYLVDANDINGYATKINELIRNTDICKKMGKYNMERVKKYDICSVQLELAKVLSI